jgi:hypothetical protein
LSFKRIAISGFLLLVAAGVLFLLFAKKPAQCIAFYTERPFGYADDNEPKDLAALRVRAEQGFAAAEYQLARRYDEGKGVAWDGTEAFKWYLKSAEQGDSRAQIAVSWAYEHQAQCHWFHIAQKPFSNSDQNAYFWASIATAHDEDFAAHRDEIAKSLSPEQIAAVKKRLPPTAATTHGAGGPIVH